MKREQLSGVGRESVVALIDEAIAKGWKHIDVSADSTLRKAIWFEGEMRGVNVRGYTPTPADQHELSAMRQKGVLPQRVLSSTVAHYYSQKVIPELERRIEKETKRLSSGLLETPKARVKTMDLVEAYRETLSRSRVLEEQFRKGGSRPVLVRPVYSDGLLRYEPAKDRIRTQGILR